MPVFPLRPSMFTGRPAARALVRGNERYPALRGEVRFYPFLDGTWVTVHLSGLPEDGFYAFHIHHTGDCSTGGDVPFPHTQGHFDPQGVQHPNHAGDLPVLLASGGTAITHFYSGRFRPHEVVSRSVIVHERPDDYRSQPAGDGGSPIACGVIRRM